MYKGRKLARPDQIVRRLAVFPILHLLRFLFCLVVWFGWGIDDAKYHWNRIEI